MEKDIKELLEKIEKLNKENKDLQAKLREANHSIELIKSGKIDALVVDDQKEFKFFTEESADKKYRILIEKMHEGAITLSKDGTILYSNFHFADMVSLPLQNVIGSKINEFIDKSTKKRFKAIIDQGWEDFSQSEVKIYSSDGKVVPVLMSVNTLPWDNNFVLSIIFTDLTIQNKNQEELKSKAIQLQEKNKELYNVNKELAFQNNEKEKRAEELSIANKELAFQNIEKEKRAEELSIANKELAFQNNEKEKRAEELSIANKELAFQNNEKEKRADELIIANKELAFQNNEKEKRAEELSIANKELAFQNIEKEKRAEELSNANKELTTFTYVSSHDLQEPLRKIQNFVSVILQEEEKNLSQIGKGYFLRMRETAKRMQSLIEDLLTYSRSKSADHVFEKTDLNILLIEAIQDFGEIIQEKNATIEAASLGSANVIPFQFRQLLQNLISNSLKFSKLNVAPHIIIKSEVSTGNKLNIEKLEGQKEYCHITFSDNGIGFDSQYENRIFEVFQRLHSFDDYKGTGIGLAICKRIIENHHGIITATGKLNEGARFDIYIPVK